MQSIESTKRCLLYSSLFQSSSESRAPSAKRTREIMTGVDSLHSNMSCTINPSPCRQRWALQQRSCERRVRRRHRHQSKRRNPSISIIIVHVLVLLIRGSFAHYQGPAVRSRRHVHLNDKRQLLRSRATLESGSPNDLSFMPSDAPSLLPSQTPTGYATTVQSSSAVPSPSQLYESAPTAQPSPSSRLASASPSISPALLPFQSKSLSSQLPSFSGGDEYVDIPNESPTPSPSVSLAPSISFSPTISPEPTRAMSVPETPQPTSGPTNSESEAPTEFPTTTEPTFSPVQSTPSPTTSFSPEPTGKFSFVPSGFPTEQQSSLFPTTESSRTAAATTLEPTGKFSFAPSAIPSEQSTTMWPSVNPTVYSTTDAPSIEFSFAPSATPTEQPTTLSPSTNAPSTFPTVDLFNIQVSPTLRPSQYPSSSTPSREPSFEPSWGTLLPEGAPTFWIHAHMFPLEFIVPENAFSSNNGSVQT